MFTLFRDEMFNNVNSIDTKDFTYELGGIRLHDGEKILASERWIRKVIYKKSGENERKIISCNSSLDYGLSKGLNFDFECKLKRVLDLSLKAFIIKEKHSSWSIEKEYILYLHIDAIKDLKKKKVFDDSLGWLYLTYYNNDLYFENMIDDLRKESTKLASEIRQVTKEMDKKYSIKDIESLNNRLKRKIKKYHAVYDKESIEIEKLKETLKDQ